MRDRIAPQRLQSGDRGNRRRLRDRSVRVPVRAGAPRDPPRSARAGRAGGASRPRRAGRGPRADRRGAGRLRGALMLSVCATPIGNLDDVTLRVLAELRAADVVLCEDTLHTRTLLARHGIEAKLVSYHEHNEASRTAELVPRLSAGERVALVSDAGMPGISDPGGAPGPRA